MKTLITLLLLSTSLFVNAQMPLPSVFFSTRTELRLQKGSDGVQVLLNGLITSDDGNGGIYKCNGSNTDADDGFITIQVTGTSTGRWKRIANGNTLKG